MTLWHGAIDESGNFDDPDDPVALGCVLYADGRLPGNARAELSGAVPWDIWPIHAAHLRHPVYFLIVQANRLEAGPRTRSGHDETIEAAMRALAAFDTAALKHAVRDVSQMVKPSISKLNVLRRGLPGPLRETLQRLALDAVNAVLAAVGRLARETGGVRGGGLSAVFAAEAARRPGVAGQEAGPVLATERYIALLETCALRIGDILQGEAPSAPCDVALDIAERPLWDEKAQRTTLLREGHRQVRTVINKLNERFKGHEITFRVQTTPPYDAQVEAPMVLADLAANTARLPLNCWPNARLRGVEHVIRETTHLPVRTCGSHLAAPDPGTARPKRWVTEQLKEWNALRGRAGGAA